MQPPYDGAPYLVVNNTTKTHTVGDKLILAKSVDFSLHSWTSSQPKYSIHLTHKFIGEALLQQHSENAPMISDQVVVVQR